MTRKADTVRTVSERVDFLPLDFVLNILNFTLTLLQQDVFGDNVLGAFVYFSDCSVDFLQCGMLSV